MNTSGTNSKFDWVKRGLSERGRAVNRTRGISRARGWGISRTRGRFGVAGFAFVPDIGDESGLVIGDLVSHDLSSAVGKKDSVFAGGGVTVALFVLGKVHSGIFVGHGVFVAVLGRSVLVDGGGAISRGGLEADATATRAKKANKD